MPGYLVRQVRVKTCIVCFLSRHTVLMPGCMGNVGTTRCGDILLEPLLKNAVAAQIVVPSQNSKEVIGVTYICDNSGIKVSRDFDLVWFML